MAGSLQNWIVLLIFTTARRLYTLAQVKRAAVAMGLTDLVTFIDECLAEDEETFNKEAIWASARKTRGAQSRGRAAEIDIANDRVISAIFSAVNDLTKTLKPTHPVYVLAQEFLLHFYPDGVSPIIRQNYEEQLVTMERMLRDFDGSYAEHVQKLPIGLHVEQLKVQVPEFRAELEAHPPATLTFDELSAARDRGQENLRAVVARIVGLYFRNTPEHLEARQNLLGPIRRQNDRLAALRRARRAGSTNIDINPTTGEEFVVADSDLNDAVETVLPVEA
ncbi:MAG: hypothetical protein H0U74_19710 [Bradymonadaceae bacterium]|nr:hypothetical protein [Lujinxingiaceae bacterium]